MKTIWSKPIVYDKPARRDFYTLTVCKECRGSWMKTIKEWFNASTAMQSPGSGIFIRENGATIEVSEQEWFRRNPDRQPVRVMEKLGD